jgi:hypothetical protein
VLVAAIANLGVRLNPQLFFDGCSFAQLLY